MITHTAIIEIVLPLRLQAIIFVLLQLMIG
jgi:hypothetical protein